MLANGHAPPYACHRYNVLETGQTTRQHPRRRLLGFLSPKSLRRCIKAVVKEKPMNLLKSLRGFLLSVFCGAILLESAIGQPVNAPLLLHPRLSADTLPVAAYRGIKVEEFRKMVIGAFENSGFALKSIEATTDGRTYYKFSYPVPVGPVDAPGKNIQKVVVQVRVNENLDKHKRCASCFLRLAELPDLPLLQKLPWMTQYQVSSAIFPAIDRAFAQIRTNGKSAMDASFPFTYQNQWQGERNLYENSFVGIDLPDLKAAIINSYRAAGFTFVNDDQLDAAIGHSELEFSFPLEPDKGAGGVVYKVSLAAQFHDRNASGSGTSSKSSSNSNNCYPCEISEAYDPYQQLPPAGLSGMTNRLSLEPRFAAARTLALERLKAATERYLRPGTLFLNPPKPAALGSPRPKILPMAVT